MDHNAFFIVVLLVCLFHKCIGFCVSTLLPLGDTVSTTEHVLICSLFEYCIICIWLCAGMAGRRFTLQRVDGVREEVVDDDVFNVENGLVGAVEDELDGGVADVINEVGMEDEIDGGTEESSESGSDSEDSVRGERILFGDPDEDILTDGEPIANEDVETLIDVAISRRVGGGGASVSSVGEVDGGVGEVDGEDNSVLGVGEVGGAGNVHNMGGDECNDGDVDSDYTPSDELISLARDSDDEFPRKRELIYNRDRDLDNPKLVVGTKFATPADFRELLRRFLVMKGFDLKF